MDYVEKERHGIEIRQRKDDLHEKNPAEISLSKRLNFHCMNESSKLLIG